jgi:hypothetical protein
MFDIDSGGELAFSRGTYNADPFVRLAACFTDTGIGLALPALCLADSGDPVAVIIGAVILVISGPRKNFDNG